MTTAQPLTGRVTAEDIYRIVLVSDAQISPDGSQVAFVRTTLDKDENTYKASIYLVPADGGTARRFTGSGGRDVSPRWSPDGEHIAFISNRSGSNQLWTISVKGGEATQVTDLPEPVTSHTWSPDGSTLAFVSQTETDQLDKKDDESDEQKSDVVHITRIQFRSDGTPEFLDDKRDHIWCVPAGSGKPWQVTQGDFDDSRPAWSPSGQEIAFSSNRTEDREYNTVSEIWFVHARGGEARRLIGGDHALFDYPAWSPDGATVAIAGHQQPITGGATNTGIWTVPGGGGDPVNLTGGLDRSAEDAVLTDTAASSDPGLVWSADGSHVYFQVSDAGSVHLYQVPSSGGSPELVIGGARRIVDYSVSRDGARIAFVAADQLNPGDIYVCDGCGGAEARLTSVNAEHLSSVTLAEPEEFRVQSHAEDRGEVHGWIMKPVGFEPGRKYPLILEIHGGPHSMYGNAFFHEFQVLAAQGNVVLYTNPRGSQGYGEAFTKYTNQAWGEKDMPDVMAAVDWAIDQGYVDSNRLGVTGGSYGGYMTNWIIGHTDRFKAAATHRCVSNLYSFFGTSDIGHTFGAYEIGGLPWDAREQYVRLSPITYVTEMKTPLLITHSEQDYRCPIEQAEQLFVFLKKLGREVEFVRFPNESHGLSRSGEPKHRVERLEHILRWFGRYL